ncbi:UNVERIFIED_CONTAM: Plasminogen [Trichonephila clavipes]
MFVRKKSFTSIARDLHKTFGRRNELRNGKWSGLNENHTFDNEMNRASSSSQNCLCGRENVKETKRIVGGSTVNPPHRFPWMVALVRRIYNVDDFYCGGALISPYYVLTAAHCFTSYG